MGHSPKFLISGVEKKEIQTKAPLPNAKSGILPSLQTPAHESSKPSSVAEASLPQSSSHLLYRGGQK